jgi:hypothetical protein
MATSDLNKAEQEMAWKKVEIKNADVDDEELDVGLEDAGAVEGEVMFFFNL